MSYLMMHYGESKIVDASRDVVCECRIGKLIYDKREKKFIHKGNCYEYRLCSIIKKHLYLNWLHKNRELNTQDSTFIK